MCVGVFDGGLLAASWKVVLLAPFRDLSQSFRWPILAGNAHCYIVCVHDLQQLCL